LESRLTAQVFVYGKTPKDAKNLFKQKIAKVTKGFWSQGLRRQVRCVGRQKDAKSFFKQKIAKVTTGFWGQGLRRQVWCEGKQKDAKSFFERKVSNRLTLEMPPSPSIEVFAVVHNNYIFYIDIGVPYAMKRPCTAIGQGERMEQNCYRRGD
jgi:hypothetical protein